MKKGEVISFSKYALPFQRAKIRAGEIMAQMTKQMGGFLIPPEIDPFKGKFEEEVTKVLFENEILLDQNRKKGGDE